MKILRIVALVLLAVGVVVAIVAPIGPLPGFFIGGEPTPAPASWPDTSEVHEIDLKVPGTLPRVVTIWVVEHDGELHVVGSGESGWVRMIGGGAPVEMRLEGHTYALQAEPVAEGKELVLQAYVDKYRPDYPDIVASFPTASEASTGVAVFRLNRG
jgi:hypothetical protein